MEGLLVKDIRATAQTLTLTLNKLVNLQVFFFFFLEKELHEFPYFYKQKY